MTTLTRLLITVCILLSGCAIVTAQKKDKDPFDRVMSELQSGRTDKAIEALDEAIKKDPKNADAYLLRGTLKMQTDFSQALRDLDKGIELKPDYGAAYHQRAMMRLVNNDVPGALKDLDAAIEHNYKDDGVYFSRAQLRWQAGEAKTALLDMDEAIKLNPSNPRAYLTRIQMLLFVKDFDKALADLNYLLSWYETDPSARPLRKPQEEAVPKSDSQPFMVAIAQETSNEAPGSQEMAPAIADSYSNRGLIMNDRGNHVAAISDFTNAIRIDPTNVWPLYHRANQHEQKGDLPAALADITKAIQIDPKNANLLIERGVILLLTGKDQDAQAEFDVFLKLDRALWQKRIDDRIAAVRKLLPPKQ